MASELLQTFNSIFNGASVYPRRHGFLGFLRDHSIVPIALIVGFFSSLAVVPYSIFLSHQHFECPSWAYQCSVYTDRIGIIQGAITLVYTVGLTCLGYACWALAEISLWPLLCLQPLTLGQVDTILAVSRGSIPSIPLALAAVRKWRTFAVVVCALLVTLTTLSAGPVIGYAYDQQSLPVSYNSELLVGGGIGPAFTQQNPPIAQNTGATMFYTSWGFNGGNNEPLPHYRDWFIPRDVLEDRGNFTAHAVRIQKSIKCKGLSLKQVNGSDSLYSGLLSFYTNMANARKGTRHSPTVAVTNRAKMSVWAHDVKYISSNRTVATLVFAVPGGKIEGGHTSIIIGKQATVNPNISALACDVDVEFIDDVLMIGNGGLSHSEDTANLPHLTSIDHLHSSNPHGRPYGTPNYTHSELALWLAVAPILSATGVTGTQPMFKPDPLLHGRLVTDVSQSNFANYNWTQSQIHEFVNISMGAMAVAASNEYCNDRLIMPFTIYAQGIETTRVTLLFVPIIVMLAVWTVLAVLTIRLHRQCNLPIMKMGETAEIVQASHHGFLRYANTTAAGGFNNIRLQYHENEKGLLGLRCQSYVLGEVVKAIDPSKIMRAMEQAKQDVEAQSHPTGKRNGTSK